MTELVDELVDIIESKLGKRKIELTAQELDEVRDILDSIIDNHEGK